MISYCVDINYDDSWDCSSTVVEYFEYEHYVGLRRRYSDECYSLVHPELQFIVIF